MSDGGYGYGVGFCVSLGQYGPLGVWRKDGPHGEWMGWARKEEFLDFGSVRFGSV